MATTAGTFYLNGCNVQLKYDLLSQSTANNTSTVRLYVVLNVTNNYISWSRGSAWVHNSGEVGIGTYYAKGSHTLLTRDYTFTHNNKGELTIQPGYGLNTSFVSGASTGTIVLPNIPRAATVTEAPNINDETTTFNVSFNNPGGFTLKPYMNFYLNGEVAKRIERSISSYTSPYTWNITATEQQELRQLLTSNNSCQVTMGFDTYSGGTAIGYNSLQRTFSIINANPTFSAAYLDTNSTTTSITDDDQLLIRNNSTLRINATSLTAYKSATLSSITAEINGTTHNTTISGSTATFNVGTLNISEDTEAVITLTDSRGNKAIETLQLQILNWELPSAIIDLQRQNNYYAATDIKVDANYLN